MKISEPRQWKSTGSVSSKGKNQIPLLVMVFFVFGTYWLLQNHDSGKLTGDLRIALGDDLAGAAMAHAAKTLGSGVAVQDSSVSFLKMTDCCGTQAEFAMAAGEFDMAVLCPDAAEAFLLVDPDYVLVGGVIENANVLIHRGTDPIKRIGYMNGRSVQGSLLKDLFPDEVDLYPMLATALPYALENQAVDAVVLDGAQGLAYDAEQITALPSDKPSQVLVANTDILESSAYLGFINRYNEMALSLNSDGIRPFLIEAIALEPGLEESEELIERWKKMETKFSTLPSP